MMRIFLATGLELPFAYSFSTWRKSSSTGVSRRDADQHLDFVALGLTSSTVPMNSANGAVGDANVLTLVKATR